MSGKSFAAPTRQKCSQTGHFTECCCPPMGAGAKKGETKNGKVNTVSAEKTEPETQESAVVDAPAAPAWRPSLLLSTQCSKFRSIGSTRKGIKIRIQDAAAGGLLKLSNLLGFRDYGLKWKQIADLKLLAISSLKTTGRLGSERRRQVMHQNVFGSS